MLVHRPNRDGRNDRYGQKRCRKLASSKESIGVFLIICLPLQKTYASVRLLGAASCLYDLATY